jgi:hypothetical protein
MSTATRLKPVAGATVADPTTAAAIVWTPVGTTPTTYLIVHNTSTTDPAFVVTAALATTSGRAVPPGGTVSFGPYGAGEELWIVGADASPVYYSFDAVFSEGF